MWWWAAALLAAAAALALFSDIRIRIRYVREGRNDEIDAGLTGFYGLVRLRRKVPMMELMPWLSGLKLKLDRVGGGRGGGNGGEEELKYTRDDVRRILRKTRLLVRHMADFREFLAGTLQHVHVSGLKWTTRIGTGDAAETGVVCGAVWGLKCAAAGAAGRWVTYGSVPQIDVAPAFGSAYFRTELVLRARIRVFRLLHACAMLLVRIARRKGGLKAWAEALIRDKSRRKRPA